MLAKSNEVSSYMFRSISFVVLLLIAQLPGAFAQDSNDDQKDRFRTLITSGGIDDLYYSQVPPPPPPTQGTPSPPDPSFKEKKLSAGCSFASPNYFFNRTKPLFIFAHGQDSNGNTLYPIVAELDLSAGPVLPMLLFSPVDTPKHRYKIMILPDDIQAFPGGSIRVVNISQSPISVNIGDGTVEVPVGSYKILTPTSKSTFTFRVVNNQSNVNVYNSLWGYRASTRITAFTFNLPAQPGVVMLSHIQDGLGFPDPSPQPVH